MAAHALLGEWGDTSGTVEAIVHRGPSERTTGPLSPGASPRTAHFLSAYKEYTSLREWEAMNSGLSKEVVPIKRRFVTDYMLAETGTDEREKFASPQIGDSSGSDNIGGLAGDIDGNVGVPRSAAVLDVAASANAVSPVRRRPPRRAGKAAEELAGNSSPSAPEPTPRRRLIAASSAPSATQVAGRVCVGLRAPAGNHFADDALNGLAALEGPGVPLRVKTVAPSSTIDASARPPVKGDNPQVVDKERGTYGSAKDMRPARKINSVSRKRLNELLKMPQARIEACDTHPSRSFGVVPSQNLRVV